MDHPPWGGAGAEVLIAVHLELVPALMSSVYERVVKGDFFFYVFLIDLFKSSTEVLPGRASGAGRAADGFRV